jgi:hypothetical protein
MQQSVESYTSFSSSLLAAGSRQTETVAVNLRAGARGYGGVLYCTFHIAGAHAAHLGRSIHRPRRTHVGCEAPAS